MLSKSVLSLVVVVVAGSATLAQQAPQTQQQAPQTQQQAAQTQQGQQSRSQEAESLQSHLAACIALANREEVVLGQLAKQQASKEQVKTFADRMIKEHQQVISQLQGSLPSIVNQFVSSTAGTTEGGAAGVTEGSAAGAREGSAAGAREGSTAGAREGSTAGAGDDRQVAGTSSEARTHTTMRPTESGSILLQIEIQAAKNCLDLTKAELSQKQGAEFDKAYMAQQISAHVGMLAKLQAMEPHVTGNLKQVVQGGISATRTHLDEAKAICKQLETQTQAAQ